MGNSFKDQFLKVGLVDSSRVKKAQPDKAKNSIQNRRKGSPAVDAAKVQAERSTLEAAERDRQLNLQRKAEADKKAIAAQIKQLIEANRLSDRDGEHPYNFTDNSKIRRLLVTEIMHKQIVAGSVAIVKLDSRYELVPSAIAEKIRARAEGYLILYNDPRQTKDSSPDAETEHPVPDDLLW